MYSTCLHCHRDLGRNEAIELFPVGRRLAFDSAKGRLWVICPSCTRWNLTPIEERWEAVESCERLFRGQRLRAQTDNIGLTRISEGTELIRVGSPLRPEFAAWRYGSVFRRRRYRRAGAIAGAGAVVAAGGVVVSGAAPVLFTIAPFFALPLVHFGLGTFLLRGNVIGTKVVGEKGEPLHVTLANLDHTKVVAGVDGDLELHLRHTYGRVVLSGDRATRALSALLVRANGGGGSTRAIARAADFIANAGDPRAAIALVAREAEKRSGDFEQRATTFARGQHGRTMGEVLRAQFLADVRNVDWRKNSPPRNPGALQRLSPEMRLALEMSLHESSEQHALDEELSILERDWREAEEIAAIADGVLTPLP